MAQKSRARGLSERIVGRKKPTTPPAGVLRERRYGDGGKKRSK